MVESRGGEAPVNVRWTRRLYRLHKWNGVMAAPLMFVICLSGAISVFHADAIAVPSRDVALEQLAAPDVAGIQFSRADGKPAVVFRNNGTQQPASAAPVFDFLRTLHARLYLPGRNGRMAVGVFGISLLISCLTGWLIHGRFVRQKGWWRIRPGRQLATSDLHKLVGITSLAFNLLIAVTGVVLAFDALIGIAPPRPVPVAPAPPPYISPSAAMTTARGVMPRLSPRLLLLPNAKSPRYTLYADLEGALTRGSASWVQIHAVTGEVLKSYDASTGPAWYQMAEPLHYGNFGGTPLKLVYAGFGLTGAALSLSGLLLTLMKRRHKRKRILA